MMRPIDLPAPVHRPDVRPLELRAPLRVLVASDNEEIRARLSATLNSIPTRYCLIGAASHSAEALRAASRLRPEIILFDTALALREFEGTGLITSLVQCSGGSVVLIAGDGEAHLIGAAIEAGAVAICWKSGGPVGVLGAINTAVFGHPRRRPY